ncbi:hypothetical protein EGR_00097 [Echinococcus granulosus]|uniref:Uncharacterized protein n=1 Tax=Echinococcus granulosus TaxID=6210 RepID=W6UU41_ECHGR|nr:hypothetical protein EGR_00097 [Echinococcus granulosus]EUB64828.1 hypothetical protein EGR_00097 [Echinococcus granulosus]
MWSLDHLVTTVHHTIDAYKTTGYRRYLLTVLIQIFNLAYKFSRTTLSATMNCNEEPGRGKHENAQKIRMDEVAGLLPRWFKRFNCILELRGCVWVQLQRRERRRAALPLGRPILVH